jgi:hypothetical protein
MTSASVDRRDPYAAAIAFAAVQHIIVDAAPQHFIARSDGPGWLFAQTAYFFLPMSSQTSAIAQIFTATSRGTVNAISIGAKIIETTIHLRMMNSVSFSNSSIFSIVWRAPLWKPRKA